MANAIYPKFKEAVLQHTANSSLGGAGATGVYAALIDTGAYTYSAAHEFYSSVVAGQLGTEIELGTKTFVDGLFDAADATFAGFTSVNAEALVIFIKNAGANTTWRLVAYFDTGVTGLPVLPNGSPIDVARNASGLSQL